MANNKMLKAVGAEVVSIEENTTADVRAGMTAYDVVMNVTGKGIVNVTLTAETNGLVNVGYKKADGTSDDNITNVAPDDGDKVADWLDQKTVTISNSKTPEGAEGVYTVEYTVEALKGYTVVVSGSGFAVEKGGYTSGTATDGYNVWIVT